MTDGVAALEEGRAFADLSAWRMVSVEGSEAGGWLNDLLSAELKGLEPGEARRSLLLTPTGRIRATVLVTRYEDAHLLVQDPRQPSRIDALLDPYVLSSDVRLRDRSEELALFAVPGRAHADASYSPSALGPGSDVIATAGERPAALAELVEASTEDVETWRVLRGMARFPVDLTADSLPHEAEQGDAVAYGKGCFLGQEAVAKVRNLGRPPFVVLSAAAQGQVAVGDVVLSGDQEAGRITSAVGMAGGTTSVIARVRWGLKDSALRSYGGVEVVPSGLASAA
ncbi:MAG: YgfZ/GcvT domain-containing protein [Actinomycetota bacterium]